MIKNIWLLCLFCLACGFNTELDLGLVSEGSIRHFPFAFNISNKTLVCWSEHADAYLYSSVDACSLLESNKPTSRNADFYISGVAQIDDLLIAESYITYAETDQRIKTNGWLSIDSGETWTPQPGVLTLTQPGKTRESKWGSYLFHRRLYYYDGVVVGTVYGNYANDPDWYTTLWVKSADLGKTWEVVSTVAAGPIGTEGYGEPVSAFCNNDIVVVTRTGPQTPMRITRSHDKGQTWEVPRSLNLIGWDPDLLLVRGVLLLSYGLTGEIHIAASNDCGQNWNVVKSLYLPTSGYTGLSFTDKLTVYIDYLNETRIVGNVTWQ